MSARPPEATGNLDRRAFIKLFGGGIIVLIAWRDALAINEAFGYDFQQRGYPKDFNAYLRIAEDGKVTVFSGKIEMGQGIHTSLAQMAAEELGVALTDITMVMGDTATCPWDAGTWGSLTTRFFGPALRAAAAEARQVLLELGAEHLKTTPDRVRVNAGAVELIADPKQRVAFGTLAAGKRIERVVAREAVLKAARDFAVMGKPVGRLDAHLKVSGGAKYAGDIRRPNMLYARLVRPPAHGSTLRRADTTAAKQVPGVVIVEEGELIAALHADPEQAEKALHLIQAEYDEPQSTLDDTNIHEHLLQHAPAPRAQNPTGDLTAGAAASTKLFEHTYHDSYYAHAPIEPHTAFAVFENGKVTVWSSTQSPFGDQQRLAQALAIPVESVRVITPQVGGGFGGKSTGGQSIEAARLARITGRPVQVMWTRAEEFFYDSFRPAAVVKIRSGIDGNGRMTLWEYDVYAAGTRGAEVFYSVPNYRVLAHGASWTLPPGVHPFATGPWRAPGNSTNTFARESQIDIMAAEAKVDPLEFRLRNCADERMRSVLKAAAERFGWQPAAAPSGRGLGVACGIDAGAYVAHIAQVDVDRATGKVKVKRVVCAQEMGIVVNPEGATMQMEGCITMGLGYALSEQVHFRGGRVLDKSFATYHVPRFSWLPEIETVLVRNDEVSPQGGGEPAIICMGAVIANAIFDATGARLYSMPMLPEHIKGALT